MTENKQFIFDRDTVAPNIKTPIVFEGERLNIGEVLDKLNELHEENQFLKEKEEHILYYLKEEYDYVCKRKIKYLDDVLLVKSYELIEYHIRSMIEYLVRL